MLPPTQKQNTWHQLANKINKLLMCQGEVKTNLNTIIEFKGQTLTKWNTCLTLILKVKTSNTQQVT
jgi:hypothetical protein